MHPSEAILSQINFWQLNEAELTQSDKQLLQLRRMKSDLE